MSTNFLDRSRTSCILLLVLFTHAQAADQQLIEVRFYHLRSAEYAAKFDAMMEHAVLPVMQSRGIGPVGVFRVLDSNELGEHARVTIVPYETFDARLKLKTAFDAAPDFWENAKSFLVQEKGDPAYERVESMLLQAFSGMPQLKVPGEANGRARRFELRTYKSENELQARMKVQMFNEGEIELFNEVGLPAAFYGEALFASNLPQLTYLLVHDDEATQQRSWSAFLNHPDWKALSGEAQYQGIKLTITKHLLAATECSQIK